MIGQQHLQSQIKQLIDNDTFPRFSIFVGPKGSGKKTFVREVIIKEITDGLYEECGIKVDDVRNLISDAYKIHSTAVYFIPDADNMSPAAKNALLKVTEEPPNNAYFIMTLEDVNNTLETIRSRGTTFHMNRYTPNDIGCYFYEKYSNNRSENSKAVVNSLCETPGEVDTLVKMGIKEFYSYVQLVVDNIADVSLANSFKIPSKVALKDDAEGYDLRLFWKAFIRICFERSFDDSVSYMCAAQVTSGYLAQLRIKGINKQMLMDNWIIDVREVLNEAV